MSPRPPLPDETWPTAAVAAASLLFSPFQLGRGLPLTSRTIVPAMVPWRATEEGHVTEALRAWYGRFADGRPGAIVVEATGVRDVPSGPLLRLHHDRYVPGLRTLVDTVRERSGGTTRLFIQLIDFLRMRRRPDPARYFREFWHPTRAHAQALQALKGDSRWLTAGDDDLRSCLITLNDEDRSRILTAREHDDLSMGARDRITDTHLPHILDLPRILPAAFADAARRAEQAGFDGIELHAAHGYTLASFLSPTNTRTDEYGGTATNRLRLPLEILRAVREAVDPNMTVGVRILADEGIVDGGTLQDAGFAAIGLAQAGVDYISVSRGGKFEDAKQPIIGSAAYPYTGPSGALTMPTLRRKGRRPFGEQLPFSSDIRARLRASGLFTPVIAAGALGSFRLAESALKSGQADLIANARQSLADPDWLQKLREGRGDQIRRCELTNYCEGLDQKHRPVTCRLWDRIPLSSEEPALRSGRRRLVAPK